jgi:hypothetical protein
VPEPLPSFNNRQRIYDFIDAISASNAKYLIKSIGVGGDAGIRTLDRLSPMTI